MRYKHVDILHAIEDMSKNVTCYHTVLVRGCWQVETNRQMRVKSQLTLSEEHIKLRILYD